MANIFAVSEKIRPIGTVQRMAKLRRIHLTRRESHIATLQDLRGHLEGRTSETFTVKIQLVVISADGHFITDGLSSLFAIVTRYFMESM